ncbi:MAG: DUF1593 domain-containing protein [Bacteroidales bacterium]|nr:DUF1593 domain-containing protein [Bacteroidales bacterium]
MQKIYLSLFLFCFLYSCGTTSQKEPASSKPRILISTDIGGTDPDDNQSMAHFLMYSEMFNTEGLVSSPSYGTGNKSEILRMIDLYEKDLPKLKQHVTGLAEPDYLRSITKQGRLGAAPFCGFQTSTEGSDWIVKCARKESDQPLWVLVWGGLDDLAQALHDAPDIKDKIKVYWIGGPNKKWSMNSYAYIVANFPDLWFIENNASYRGFISNKNKEYEFNQGFYETYIQGNGHLGADFFNYLQGNPKLGDTPSLLYMMDGGPNDPEEESWGGSFVKLNYSPRIIFNGITTEKDTTQIYSTMEFNIKGPKIDIPIDSACITMTIANQTWGGYYQGDGIYTVRHSTYALGTLPYTITSDIPGFVTQKGAITIENVWPGEHRETDYQLGENWFTDKSDEDLSEDGLHGSKTVSKWRNEVMKDWAKRWSWLKE